jgi:hypothetical protein
MAEASPNHGEEVPRPRVALGFLCTNPAGEGKQEEARDGKALHVNVVFPGDSLRSGWATCALIMGLL